MKFSIGTVLAFAAAVLAKPILLNSNYQVEEGKPFTLRWGNAQGPVTITIMTGDPGQLNPVTVIATGRTGTEFTFTPENLPSGTYAFRITDSSGEPNYSQRFQYVGTGSLTTTSTSLSSTSGSSTSTTVSSTSSSSSGSSTTSSSTSSSSTTSNSSTTTTTSATSTTRTPSATNTPLNTNNAKRFASPLALVLVTVAALVFVH